MKTDKTKQLEKLLENHFNRRSEFYVFECTLYVKMNFEMPFAFKIENIAKHSNNIINLIEVGDIIMMLDTKFNSKDFIFIDDEEMLQAVKEDLKERCKLLNILTHEQYQANCYTVERRG